jgi:hypothetical protein
MTDDRLTAEAREALVRFGLDLARRAAGPDPLPAVLRSAALGIAAIGLAVLQAREQDAQGDRPDFAWLLERALREAGVPAPREPEPPRIVASQIRSHFGSDF